MVHILGKPSSSGVILMERACNQLIYIRPTYMQQILELSISKTANFVEQILVGRILQMQS
jgi:hypothetical protein